MRRALLAIVAMLAAVAFAPSPVQAARQTAEVTSFTLDAVSSLGSAAGKAARGWDQGTVVDLTRGDCAGYHCVTIVQVPTSTYCYASAAGCAAHFADGSCFVEITDYAVAAGRDVVASTVAHEVGHCMGLPHIDDWSSIMYYADSGAWITDADRERLNAIWAP